jgi:hypothetical protein
MRQLQIARMEIVGNEWQEMGIISPGNFNDELPFADKNKPGKISGIFIEDEDEDDPTFQVAVINTEDNADYVPPKGVKVNMID